MPRPPRSVFYNSSLTRAQVNAVERYHSSQSPFSALKCESHSKNQTRFARRVQTPIPPSNRSSPKKCYSNGSSSGYSSSDCLPAINLPPIEEHEIEAIAILRETSQLLIKEEEELKSCSKALRRKMLQMPHYECLTGAMIKRAAIQQESYETYGDRHYIDDHERIYGEKKEWRDQVREGKMRVARWMLKNEVEKKELLVT